MEMITRYVYETVILQKLLHSKQKSQYIKLNAAMQA